jgi:hypothetical protein
VTNPKGFRQGLAVFYQASVFDTRTVIDSPNPTVNGTYRTMNHAGMQPFDSI